MQTILFCVRTANILVLPAVFGLRGQLSAQVAVATLPANEMLIRLGEGANLFILEASQCAQMLSLMLRCGRQALQKLRHRVAQ